MKKIVYLGGAEKDIQAFSEKPKQRLITALTAISASIHLNPKEFKYMPTVGIGTYEIRLAVDKKAYRIFYVAKFAEAIYVLHAFIKKTRQTSQKEIELGATRYKILISMRREKGYD